MAQVVRSEPALSGLEASADYIALENSAAAAAPRKRVSLHVEQLADHFKSGSRPAELGNSRYRQIIEPICRVFYRIDQAQVTVLHVMRTERLLRKKFLAAEKRRKGSKRRRSFTPHVLQHAGCTVQGHGARRAKAGVAKRLP